MCGINGIVNLSGSLTRDLRPVVAAMNQGLVHRGPDDAGEFHATGVGLGFRRLSILDLSEAGHQPMCNEDGTLWLVFNGEIYNYIELRTELLAYGHAFRSRCDAEVILHGYEQWGEDCLGHFNGMWALAIWDTKRRCLFAARDRFGVKPFLYYERGGEFAFSSEINGLLAAYPLRKANLAKLHEYLAFGYRVNDGATFFDGVNELQPGHCLAVAGGRVEVRRWWTLGVAPPEAGRGVPAAAVRDLLTDAVRLRLRSDVPVALLQSGGLDSSIICAIVNDEVAAGRLGTDAVTAFTSVYPGHAFDESAKVDMLLERCPHIRAVQVQPFAGDIDEKLPEFVRAMQEPMFSATVYAHWCLMKAVREQGFKVVLNGQGADEAFAGYGRYISGYRLLDLLFSKPWRLPAEMRNIRARQAQTFGTQAAQFAKAWLGRRAAAAWRGWVTEGASRFLAPAFRAEHGNDLADSSILFGAGNLDRHLRGQLLQYGFNQILQYEDVSSMSQGVEMRSPFVDYRLMEMAFSIPVEARFSAGVTKRILREAFADRLPAAIVGEHGKIGFATPTERWFGSQRFMAYMAQMVATPEFMGRTIWDGSRLAKAMTGRATVPRDFPLWRFINTEIWLRTFAIDNA